MPVSADGSSVLRAKRTRKTVDKRRRSHTWTGVETWGPLQGNLLNPVKAIEKKEHFDQSMRPEAAFRLTVTSPRAT